MLTSFVAPRAHQVFETDFQLWPLDVDLGYLVHMMNITDPFTMLFEAPFRITRALWTQIGMLGLRAPVSSRNRDLVKLFMTIPAIWFNGYFA